MINKLFIGLRSWPTSLLKNNAQPAETKNFGSFSATNVATYFCLVLKCNTVAYFSCSHDYI